MLVILWILYLANCLFTGSALGAGDFIGCLMHLSLSVCLYYITKKEYQCKYQLDKTT